MVLLGEVSLAPTLSCHHKFDKTDLNDKSYLLGPNLMFSPTPL